MKKITKPKIYRTNPFTDKRGNTFYYDENSIFHREDGPAITDKYGSEWYYIHGVHHRENGPAVIDRHYEFSPCWYLNGIKYETPEDMPLSLFFAYCKYTLYGCSNDSRDT